MRNEILGYFVRSAAKLTRGRLADAALAIAFLATVSVLMR
jgi:hypothetical protein